MTLAAWQRLTQPTLTGNKDQTLGDSVEVSSVGREAFFMRGGGGGGGGGLGGLGDNHLFGRIWERTFFSAKFARYF